jgi:hypothetical protein
VHPENGFVARLLLERGEDLLLGHLEERGAKFVFVRGGEEREEFRGILEGQLWTELVVGVEGMMSQNLERKEQIL